MDLVVYKGHSHSLLISSITGTTLSCHGHVRGHTRTQGISELLTPTFPQPWPLTQSLSPVGFAGFGESAPPPNINFPSRQGHSTPVVSLSLDRVQPAAGSGAPVATLLFLLASTGSTQLCF